MKKLILIICIAILFQSFAYAESEGWLLLGAEYSKFSEHSSDGTTTASSTIDSVGINTLGFTFWNKSNFGIYSHGSVMFPQFGSLSMYGESVVVDLSQYDFLMSIGLIMGPAYRNSIAETITFYSGIGVHSLEIFGYNEMYVDSIGSAKYMIMGINLGVGGDLGFKFDIIEDLSISIGTSLTYDFFNYTHIASNLIPEPIGNIPPNYSAFMFSPYICIASTSFKGRDWSTSK